MAKDKTLVYSPTWAIATTCAVFIVVSLIAERTLYFIGHCLEKYKKTALREAFEKVKEELMMVGFISITLALGQDAFSTICVPANWSTVMRLCKNSTSTIEGRMTREIRGLAEDTQASQTCKSDQSPVMTTGGIHQLHILIFILATVHVVYTVVTVALGMWTVRHWKVWEERARTKEQLTVHGGLRLARETTFIQAHHEWNSLRILTYVVAFFKQFHNVVSETDYHTLRNGFIKNHMPSNTAFNFHKYIRRSLQDDFKYVVGISPILWGYAILWLLTNVDGWESNIIVTAIPLILVLAIGTKLQHIITEMAVHFNNEHSLIVGLPDVTPNDKLFWFNRPRFILLCIHFILFQNALEISFDIWAAISFPPDNCLYHHRSLLIGRIVIGIVVPLLCGTITLPIYALVSQMGSSVKKTIFEEHIQKALRKWREDAKLRVRKAHERSRRPSPLSSPFQERSRKPSPLSSPFQERSRMTSPQSSPVHQDNGPAMEMLLHNFPNLWSQRFMQHNHEMVLQKFPNLPSQSSVRETGEVRVSINNSTV